jgi:hypothetical protein
VAISLNIRKTAAPAHLFHLSCFFLCTFRHIFPQPLYLYHGPPPPNFSWVADTPRCRARVGMSRPVSAPHRQGVAGGGGGGSGPRAMHYPAASRPTLRPFSAPARRPLSGRRGRGGAGAGGAGGGARPTSASSQRTVRAAQTPLGVNYPEWGADAVAALDRRAPTPVGRRSFWNDDRHGRWRGLGRAQWGWHRTHGHSKLATEVERRPWDKSSVHRVPVSFQYQLTQKQRDLYGDVSALGGSDGIGGGVSLRSSLSVVAEDAGSWRQGTPSRMMGTSRPVSRGWTRTPGSPTGGAARRVEPPHSRTKARMISDIDRFESTLRAAAAATAAARAVSADAGADADETAAAAVVFVDSSEEEEEADPLQPPTARGWTADRVQGELQQLAVLHEAAVGMQKHARGWLQRK